MTATGTTSGNHRMTRFGSLRITLVLAAREQCADDILLRVHLEASINDPQANGRVGEAAPHLNNDDGKVVVSTTLPYQRRSAAGKK